MKKNVQIFFGKKKAGGDGTAESRGNKTDVYNAGRLFTTVVNRGGGGDGKRSLWKRIARYGYARYTPSGNRLAVSGDKFQLHEPGVTTGGYLYNTRCDADHVSTVVLFSRWRRRKEIHES